MIKKKIYYWSPHLTEIATIKAVINSAYSIKRFFKEYDPTILDAAGEFEKKKKEIDDKKIGLINLYKFRYISFLPIYGKIYSRFSYLVIFLLSFFSLKNLLKKDKPDFLIIHLITSLPLLLFSLFNFKTKCILRISGYPEMNKFRIFFWKILLKKVFAITCPTKTTYEYIKSLKICEENKLRILFDPIIIVNEIKKKKKIEIKDNNFILAAGRLTKQKNFSFLIDCFKEINVKFPELKLLILGNGEQKSFLQKKIYEFNLSQSIKIIPFQKNIFPYFYKCKCFIMCSLWEDPGFVILESAYSRSFIISSNFKHSSEEIIKKNNTGLLYNIKSKKDFNNKFYSFMSMSKDEQLIYKRNALIMSRNFTIFNHSKYLNKILLNKS